MASRGKALQAQMIRAQRARQMAGMPTYGFFGDILKGAGKIATSLIPGPVDDIIFEGVSGIFGSSNKPGAKASCPTGWRANPRTGRCEAIGARGALQRFIPGGETGLLPATGPGTSMQKPVYGNAVVGSFGMPALEPIQDTTPTLRCPPGAVLGKDNLCYEKSAIPRSFRKWKPGPRPKISAAEWKTLRKADSVAKKAKDVASKAGFSCRKR